MLGVKILLVTSLRGRREQGKTRRGAESAGPEALFGVIAIREETQKRIVKGPFTGGVTVDAEIMRGLAEVWRLQHQILSHEHGSEKRKQSGDVEGREQYVG